MNEERVGRALESTSGSRQQLVFQEDGAATAAAAASLESLLLNDTCTGESITAGASGRPGWWRESENRVEVLEEEEEERE